MNMFGLPEEFPEAEGMSYPVRCKWCRNVHDAATVTVVQRYLDCSTWRCPDCRTLIDDRPLAIGGGAEPVAHHPGALR